MRWTSPLTRILARRHPASFDITLQGPRVTLRLGDNGDWRAWRALREASRADLEPWEPKWPPDALAQTFFLSLLRRQWRQWRSGKAYAFAILRHDLPQPILIGGITLGDIDYGPSRKGVVGYWLGTPFAGQGLMTEAVTLVCAFAFETLRLKKVEASCMPANEASKAVLEKCGFAQTDFVKGYLQINGKREDHQIWSRTRPAPAEKSANGPV